MPAYYLLGYGSATWPILAFIPVFSLIWFGLWLAIASGRRWALVIYVLLFVVGGWAQLIANPGADLGRGVPVSIWTLLSLCVDTAGVVLLLTPSSRAWFATSKAARHREVTAS